jgi:hypothetical protein
MADMLQSGVEWLAGMREKHVGRPVSYSREGESVSLMATVGRTAFEIEDSSGGLTQFVSRDFIFTASALVLGGIVTEPLPDDIIHESGLTYQVMAPGREQCWRYSDQYRVSIRVHTKQIASE